MSNTGFGQKLKRWLAALMVAGAVGLPTALSADDQGGGNPEQQDHGLRLTPGMARAMAGIYTQNMLRQRYELPEERMEQAQELVARRIMQLAHKIDEPGSQLIEGFLEAQLNKDPNEDSGFMPAGHGQEFAKQVLPLLPEINEMAKGVVQDVRPMLPIKQQLKMATDMMAFKTAVDAFETTMSKWASGEVKEYHNPFRRQQPEKRDEFGQTEQLKRARESAQSEVEKGRAHRWAEYVEKFKQLYELDSTQASTADSILREFTEREQSLLADQSWRERIYQGQLWMELSNRLPGSWNHPLRTLAEDNNTLARKPWNELEEQFKARLESVPTSAQRRAANAHVAELLKEKGLQLEGKQ